MAKLLRIVLNTKNAQNNSQLIQSISVKSPYWASVVRARAYRIYLETNYWVQQKQGQYVTLKTSMYLETLKFKCMKGQEISKENCNVFNSLKKPTKKFP